MYTYLTVYYAVYVLQPLKYYKRALHAEMDENKVRRTEVTAATSPVYFAHKCYAYTGIPSFPIRIVNR